MSTSNESDELSDFENFEGIMAEFKEDYNDPVKLEFIQRVPDYLRLFLI